jgi:aspartyl-tRNA(Asn)/glutamyl-tRNA(Gln) amidotransferase subunit C
MNKSKQPKIDIDHVTKLANLELTPKEIKKFSKQLPKILEYVEKLSQVDTKNVKPLAHAAGLTNVWKEDEAIPSLTSQEALSNTKKTHNDLFRVKAIFDEI